VKESDSWASHAPSLEGRPYCAWVSSVLTTAVEEAVRRQEHGKGASVVGRLGSLLEGAGSLRLRNRPVRGAPSVAVCAPADRRSVERRSSSLGLLWRRADAAEEAFLFPADLGAPGCMVPEMYWAGR
jgi:hypothetical protein